MKRLILITLIVFTLTFNLCYAKTEKNGEDTVDTVDFIENVEQSQDQEEFYQMDEEELNQMGYEVRPKREEILDEVFTAEEEDNSVSLDASALSSAIPPSAEKLFILGAEKSNEYNEVGAVNMFWYQSKNFTNTYYQDVKNRSPMPILLNSSYIMNEMGKDTTVYVGQSSLSGFNDLAVGFVRSNETTYDTGARIVSKSKFANFTTGIYNSTLNHRLSGGAILSSNAVKIPKVKGSFIFGGGYYSNELDNDNKNTAGVFSEYKINRLKLNVQAAKSKYANSENLETSLYFTPELRLTDSLSLKTRFVKNISQETDQGEIGFSYKPKKNNSRDLEIEFNAANSSVDSQNSKQRFRFSAKFKI